MSDDWFVLWNKLHIELCGECYCAVKNHSLTGFTIKVQVQVQVSQCSIFYIVYIVYIWSLPNTFHLDAVYWKPNTSLYPFVISAILSIVQFETHLSSRVSPHKVQDTVAQ